MGVKENLDHLKKNLNNADCRLIAVSKTHSAEAILEAYNTGHRDFGENKVQELVEKHAALPQDIRWHMIGHLQRNKVKYLVNFISLIHGVDSMKLLQEIDKEAGKAGKIVNCLLQVHIAEESTKFGLNEVELQNLLLGNEIAQLQNIKIAGLMGMATYTDDDSQVRHEFKKLRSLMEKLKHETLPDNVSLEELSMGMSGDYSIAIEEGSTMIRIGSAIFGERNYNNEQ
jgi:PLP dependent protein